MIEVADTCLACPRSWVQKPPLSSKENILNHKVEITVTPFRRSCGLRFRETQKPNQTLSDSGKVDLAAGVRGLTAALVGFPDIKTSSKKSGCIRH